MTIKTLHKEEEITFIKIRSTMYEIMIAPDKEFTLIVLQDDPSNIAKNQWEREYLDYIREGRTYPKTYSSTPSEQNIDRLTITNKI